MLSRKVLPLLDLVVGLMALLQLVESLRLLGRGVGFQGVLAVVGSLGVIGCWLGWRRFGLRPLLPLLCLSAFATLAIQGAAGLLTIIVGMGLVTFAYGRRVALALDVGLSLLVLAMQVLGWGQRVTASVLVQDAGTFVIFGLGILMGQVLRELDTERRRNEELLDQVRRSAATEQELMLAGERARSARELHDGLGHQLTLVVLSLEYAQRMRDRDPGKAFAEVAQAHATATEALAHMRRWVRALNPPREQELRGNQAFEAIADSFRGTGLDVVFSHTGAERDLGQRASLFALRLVQEGLTNVLRHAEADRVELHVDWGADRLRLVLRDDGGPGAQLEPGFGLRSLAERATELGGHFRATATAAGVELFAEVPLEETR